MSEADQVDDLNQEIASQVSEAVEKPVAEPPKAEPEKPDPQDPTGLRATLKKAMADTAAKETEREKNKDNSRAPQTDSVQAVRQPNNADGERPRGPDGKFLPKDGAPQPQAAQKVDVKPSKGAQPGAEPPQKADVAPGTWRAEAKAKWDSLDPLIKAEVLKREDERTKEVAKYQQQISQINNAYGPIEKLIGPRRALWRAQFGGESQAIERLLNLSDLASQNPNDFLAYFLSQPDVVGRVDLQKVFGPQAGGEGSLADRTVQTMQQEISGLKQQLQGFLGQHQSQQVNSVEQQIAEFASATGSDGSPLRPHFEAVREDVFNIIPALKAQFPSYSVSQILEKAYQTAIHTNDTVAGELRRIEEERIRSDIEKAERVKKAQLAQKSIPSGAPAGKPVSGAADPTDLRGFIKGQVAAWKNGEHARI